jgi:hypothetical protein
MVSDDDEKVFSEDDDEELGLKSSDPRLTRNELRNTRSRIRNQVARDSRNSEKRAVDAARRIIDQASHYANENAALARTKKRKAEAVCYAAANLANKVLNSFNITVPVMIEPMGHKPKADEPGVGAYTDFQSIRIRIDTTRYNTDDPVSMARLLNDVKAIVYHEGGHMLFTHKFYDVCKEVHSKLGISYNEWGNFTASRKFTGNALQFGLTNGVIDVPTFKTYTDNTPPISMIMRAWNILEDQRMETAVVNTSPVMARYLSPLVLANVATPGKEEMAWPWVIGRKYLPKKARDVFRDLALATKAAPLIPRMEEIVMQYRRSNDVHEMYDLCVEFAEYMFVWLAQFSGKGQQPNNPGEHGQYPGQDNGRANKVVPVPNPDDYESDGQPIAESTNPSTQPNDEKDSGCGDKDENGKSDADNESSEDGAGPAGQEQATANRDTNASLRDIRDELSRKIMDSTKGAEVNEFMADVHTATSAFVVPDQTRQLMNTEERQRSIEVNNRMRDVLDKLVSHDDPSWTFYQDTGVLDPVGYKLAEPGDFNYWSDLSGEGRTTQNLSVTLLLDTSGSMGADDTELSVAAMGIRKACEHLGILCTVMTFNDQVRMVVEGTDNTDYVRVAANGGTEIFNAMQTINHYRYAKDFQLVVVLTDGDWSDVKDLRTWSSPGRHIMLVGFRMDESYLVSKGADSIISIDNLSELPVKVTQALAGYFS